jgi:hypothetical protein
MLKYWDYYVAISLLFLIPEVATAQYAPDPITPSGGQALLNPAVWLIIIGGVGVVLYGLYRVFGKQQEQPRQTSPSTHLHEKPGVSQTTSTSPKFVPGSVFISYRRDDSADIAGRIYDRLIQRFSKDIVFKDVDSIPLGIDFRQHLESALSQCRILLAIMGDEWRGGQGVDGKRRIDDPRDHVRLELEVALGRNIPVIPILVRNASIPAEEELPPSLKSLAYRNGIQVRPDPDFHGDMDRLIKGIEPHLTR